MDDAGRDGGRTTREGKGGPRKHAGAVGWLVCVSTKASEGRIRSVNSTDFLKILERIWEELI